MPKMEKDGAIHDCPKRNIHTWLKNGWKIVEKPKSFEKPKEEKIKSFTKKVEKPKVKEVKNAE